MNKTLWMGCVAALLSWMSVPAQAGVVQMTPPVAEVVTPMALVAPPPQGAVYPTMRFRLRMEKSCPQGIKIFGASMLPTGRSLGGFVLMRDGGALKGEEFETTTLGVRYQPGHYLLLERIICQ